MTVDGGFCPTVPDSGRASVREGLCQGRLWFWGLCPGGLCPFPILQYWASMVLSKALPIEMGSVIGHAEVVGHLCQRTLLCVDYTVCTVHQYFKQ